MAVLDKKNSQIGKVSDTTDKAEGESKGTVVDVLVDKSLPTGDKVKLDASEDAWEYAAPAPTGRYSLKLFLAKDGVKLYDDDPNRAAIYGIAIEAKIVNSHGGEFDGSIVFPRVSTAIRRGKNISTAAGLISKLGYKIPAEADHLTIARLMVQALKKELDWKGWSKTDNRNVCNSMEDFPKDETGNPKWQFEYKTSKSTTEDIKAQLNVVHWYGKGETASIEKGKPSPAQSRTTVTLRPASDEEEEGTVQQAKGATASASQGLSDDTLLEDLEA